MQIIFIENQNYCRPPLNSIQCLCTHHISVQSACDSIFIGVFLFFIIRNKEVEKAYFFMKRKLFQNRLISKQFVLSLHIIHTFPESVKKMFSVLYSYSILYGIFSKLLLKDNLNAGCDSICIIYFSK